jgi:hypothetical protein
MRILGLVLISSAAAADPARIEGCAKTASMAFATRVAADLHTTYAVDGTQAHVCVERAEYPLMLHPHAHQLVACFIVAVGKDRDRFCGTANSMFADFHGYRISVSLRKPRFTSSCDVWLQVDHAPPSQNL